MTNTHLPAEQLAQLKGHTGSINGLAFSPDAHRLAKRQLRSNGPPLANGFGESMTRAAHEASAETRANDPEDRPTQGDLNMTVHNSFGPWSTALSSTASAPLSVFWKRRMALLPRLRHSAATVSRRQWLGLLAAGLCTGAIPVLRGRQIVAEPFEAAVVIEQPRNAPGRIFASVFLRDEDDKLGQAIVAIDPASGDWTKIAERGGGLRISPDGKTVAIDDGGQTWIAEMGGSGAPRRVADVGGFAPLWSADGKEIITSGMTEQHTYLNWRVPAQGGISPKAVPIPASDQVQDWSPDGKWLAVMSDHYPVLGQYHSHLYLVQPDGTNPRQLTSQERVHCDHPRFSPDSREIVYRQSQVGLAALRVMSVDGTQEREIYRGGQQVGKPHPFLACWSPDGQSLAAIVFDNFPQAREGEKLPTIEDRNFRIVILSADGKELRELLLPEQAAVRVTAVNHLDWR